MTIQQCVWEILTRFGRVQKSLPITRGFAKLGGGVTTQTVAGARTAGDSPNGARLHPQLRKAAGPL